MKTGQWVNSYETELLTKKYFGNFMRSQSKYIPLRSEELPALPPAFISK